MGDLGPSSSSLEMQCWQGWGYQWGEPGAKQGVWNTLPTPDLSRGNVGFQKQEFSALTHSGLFTRKCVWDVPGSGWHQLPWPRRSDTLQAAPSASAVLCIQGVGGWQAEKLGFILCAHWEAEPYLHWARRVCWLHRFALRATLCSPGPAAQGVLLFDELSSQTKGSAARGSLSVPWEEGSPGSILLLQWFRHWQCHCIKSWNIHGAGSQAQPSLDVRSWGTWMELMHVRIPRIFWELCPLDDGK